MNNNTVHIDGHTIIVSDHVLHQVKNRTGLTITRTQAAQAALYGVWGLDFKCSYYGQRVENPQDYRTFKVDTVKYSRGTAAERLSFELYRDGGQHDTPAGYAQTRAAFQREYKRNR